ncbi:hypothetical protein K435DRAFT_734270, partial [Dendrothele bispora CBS 962.96]
MPGPGKKANKTKGRPPTKPSESSTALVPESYVGDIDNADGWNQIVNILCDFYKLPDLTTRGGLKKIHNNFDTIFKRLDTAYKKHLPNDRIRCAILGIYSKMAVDSILRDKLFDRGLLPKLLELLEIPQCLYPALRYLSSVAHHGSPKVYLELTKQYKILLNVLNDHSDDLIVCELAVAILSHTINGVHFKVDLNHKSSPQYKLMQTLDMPTILTTVTSAMKQPNATRYCLGHGETLISYSALFHSKAILSNPSALNFLVAGLRSAEWESRCMCLAGLLRLYRLDSEDDIRLIDPNAMMNALMQKFPPAINDTLMDYGPTRCEVFVRTQTSRDFMSAIMQAAQDKDLFKLGLALYECVIRTEFSIPDGYFQGEDPRTGRVEKVDIGLPFQNYPDALPVCAKLFRTRGKAYQDKADVLDIKFLIMRQRVGDAAELARKSLTRNPDFAYYHYAISLVADAVVGLKAAKKGLKCKQTTPFIRFQLMQRAVEHAGELGIKMLEETGGEWDKKWEEGIAFLMSASEDARQFVAEGPPDNRYMRNVLYWNILLTLAIQGPAVTPNLEQVRPSIEKLKWTDDLADFLKLPTPKTCLRNTEQIVVKSFSAAVQEWGEVIERLGKDGGKGKHDVTEPPIVSPGVLEDNLAGWLDAMHMDDGGEAKLSCEHPKVNVNSVELYHCSWCGNPSAVLRKCAGCSLTRYCDSACQKAHWPDHK